MTYLSSYESQVLWAIFRKTYGWQKKEDWITNTQLSKMTNIKECHISRTMKKLIKRNMVIKNGKKISFQKDYDKWEKIPIQVTNKKIPKQDKKIPIQVTKDTHPGIKKIPIQVYTKETKETTTKETIQDVRKAVSASLKEKAPANNVEYDQELHSWHGIDEDIIEDWEKRFPNISVGEQLMKIREHFKNNPDKEKEILKKFEGRMPIYINDWLERAEKYRIEIK